MYYTKGMIYYIKLCFYSGLAISFVFRWDLFPLVKDLQL